MDKAITTYTDRELLDLYREMRPDQSAQPIVSRIVAEFIRRLDEERA